MSSICLLLTDGSRDLSQTEKKIVICKFRKYTTIFTQVVCFLSENTCHFVNLLRFTSVCLFFLSLRYITRSNSLHSKSREQVEYLALFQASYQPCLSLILQLCHIMPALPCVCLVYFGRLVEITESKRQK